MSAGLVLAQEAAAMFGLMRSGARGGDDDGHSPREAILVAVAITGLCTLVSGLVNFGIDHLRKHTGLDVGDGDDGGEE